MAGDEKNITELQQELQELSARLMVLQDQLNKIQKKPGDVSATDTSHPAGNKRRELHRAPSKSSLNLEHFIGLRLLHLAGIVVLVIGISIGVKYAVDHELVPPLLRIVFAYIAGAVLLFFAARVRARLQLFSAILFSGAMASLYFTTYAAFAYYQLLPGGLAFALMAAITVYTAYMAIRYDKQEIAILGMTGAYGIPFLLSANSGRADLFFAYIILINGGILFLSYKKEWRAMVRLAMLVSWTLFIGWAASKYNPALQVQATVIMCVFFLLFAFAAIGFATRRQQRLDIVEVQLFLLNNFLAFSAALLIFTQATLDERSTGVMAMATLFFAAEALLVRLFLQEEKLVFNYLVAFAVLSLTCYTGLRWDGLKVTIAWMIIAIGLFSAGIIGKTGWLRLLAMLLMGVTLGKLVVIDRARFSTEQKIIAYISIGVILLLLSFFYQRYRKEQGETQAGTSLEEKTA